MVRFRNSRVNQTFSIALQVVAGQGIGRDLLEIPHFSGYREQAAPSSRRRGERILPVYFHYQELRGVCIHVE
ncbi:hypothetical protein [Rubinisphaera margarita]|uniref:hypothetical protein n=1 Tax=Rubinisphaera margarita TaxID=2909586 RepID=UPI001EE8A224|nr:hypothetical protein [Rubinisphaera margarita]MCG6155082.1 hypothetical protein [Rubinisphaera margarita]